MNAQSNGTDAEKQRLQEIRNSGIAWKKRGPCLSERQWGTVREDYSANGDAWEYFSHDQARPSAYHSSSQEIQAWLFGREIPSFMRSIHGLGCRI
jgi:hypothetical protein